MNKSPYKKKKKEEIQVSFLRPSVLNKQGRLYNYMSTCDLKDNLLYRLQRLAVTLYFCMQICVPHLPSSSSWVILCRSLCHPLIFFFFWGTTNCQILLFMKIFYRYNFVLAQLWFFLLVLFACLFLQINCCSIPVSIKILI